MHSYRGYGLDMIKTCWDDISMTFRQRQVRWEVSCQIMQWGSWNGLDRRSRMVASYHSVGVNRLYV